ncbi:MAG: DUF87 domain-containing protein, partial [Candidatus Altiarchaeales archaeon]|nr:DUF87 domain-containing protein [Candidatus Altiarchaeales archaeon]
MNSKFITLIAVLILVSTAYGQETPPYAVVGRVYQQDGETLQADAAITLIYLPTSESLSQYSSASGDYLFDISDLPGGYEVGEQIQIIAEYNNSGASVVETIIEDGPIFAQNLVLGPLADNVSVVPNYLQGGETAEVIVTSLVINAVVNATIEGATTFLTQGDPGTYSGYITAPNEDGIYVVDILLESPEGTRGHYQKLLTVDNLPPSLVIYYPTNGTATTNLTILLEGITEPDATVTVNGVDVNVSELGRFNHTVALEAGTNIIVVDAKDRAANINRTRITIFLYALYISEISADSVQLGEGTTIYAEVISTFDIAGVIAQVTSPDLTTLDYPMVETGGGYDVDIPEYDIAQIGDYNITVTATDVNGNTSNGTGWFEVYTTKRFQGDILDSESNPVSVTFKLYRPGTEYLIHEFMTDVFGEYDVTIHTRNYDPLLEFSDMKFKLDNINFTSLHDDPIDVDLLEGNEVYITNADPLKGFGVDTNMTSTGMVVITYSQLDINNEELIEIHGCSDWDFGNKTCKVLWMAIDSQVDKFANTVTAAISKQITPAAYMAVEASKCGDGECEIEYGEFCSNCPIDCGTCPTGGGGATDVSGIEATLLIILERIGLLEERLNSTQEQININLQSREVTEYLRGAIYNQTQDMALLLLAKKIELVSGYQVVSAELYPGEFTKTSIRIKNPSNKSTTMLANISGKVMDFVSFENQTVELKPGEESDLIINTFIPEGTTAGNYYGELTLTIADITSNIPVNIRVLERRERLLDLKINPLMDVIAPGRTLRVDVSLYNLGTKDVDVEFLLQLVDSITNDIVVEKTENISIAAGASIPRIDDLNISEGVREGKYIVKGIARYQGEGEREVISISYVDVNKSFFELQLFGIPIWIILLVFFLITLAYVAFLLYKREQSRKKRYLELVELGSLPQPGPRSGVIGKLAETAIRAFMPVDRLQMHTLIAGATGCGKTVAAQVLVEEALLKEAAVLIFDPTAQWSGFLRANKDAGMFRLYPAFKMKESDARVFNGNVYTITEPGQRIEIGKHIKPGEISVFCLHKLDPSQIDSIVENTVREVFLANLEETPKLRALFVYDEVHRLLPKFGGSGKGFTQVERAVREFRKWGIGLVLISQVLSDFVGEIKANIGTEIQMRSRYEGDLERIKMKYGEDILRSVVKSAVGTGMVQNAEYNKGRPYFVSFRPLLHNPHRLSDEELDNYDKFNKEITKLRDKLDILKTGGIDVFDLDLELNLAQDNVKKGSFDVVKMYLESLGPRIEDEFSKMGTGEREKAEAKAKEDEDRARTEAEKSVKHGEMLEGLKERREERNEKWQRLKTEKPEEKPSPEKKEMGFEEKKAGDRVREIIRRGRGEVVAERPPPRPPVGEKPPEKPPESLPTKPAEKPPEKPPAPPAEEKPAGEDEELKNMRKEVEELKELQEELKKSGGKITPEMREKIEEKLRAKRER